MSHHTLKAFTEESIQLSKEFSIFIQERQAIELEYGRQLASHATKFLDKYNMNSSVSSGNRQNANSMSIDNGMARELWLKSTLWSTVMEQVKETLNFSHSYIHMSSQMNRVLMVPLNQKIIEMESTWQKHEMTLARAQETVQGARQAERSAKDLHMTALKNSANNINELNKSNTSLYDAEDKERKAESVFIQSESNRKRVEEIYTEKFLPQVIAVKEYLIIKYNFKDIKDAEVDRYMYMKKVVVGLFDSQLLLAKSHNAWTIDIANQLARINHVDDMEEIINHGLSTKDDSRVTRVSVGLKDIINQTRHGQLFIKKGDGKQEWINNYFILNGPEFKMYCFDDEYAKESKSVIDLKDCTVSSVDDSFFLRPNVFQLVYKTKEPTRKDTCNIIYFIAQSKTEKCNWISCLRTLCFCCPKCATEYGFDDQKSNKITVAGERQKKRNLQIYLGEMKEIVGGKDTFYYAVISTNNVKQAKTGKTPEKSAFWNEEFQLNDFPHCHSRLRVSIHDAQNHEEVGNIMININNLKERRKTDEWYSVKAVEGGSFTASIKISLMYMTQFPLPASYHNRILDLIAINNHDGIQALYNAFSRNKDGYSKLLLQILIAQKKEVQIIKELVTHDIYNTENANVIFRGNTLSTKLIDQYMKYVGTSYLNETICGEIRSLYTLKDSLEVDPNKLTGKESNDAVEKNLSRLILSAESLWNTISDSVDKFPRELVYLMSFIRNIVTDLFPDDKNVQYSCVSGFVFLRFFCPAVLSPKLFGVMNENPDSNTARSLMLIGKILMNLANLVEFGGKESHMIILNPFINYQIKFMKEFIDNITDFPQTDSEWNGSQTPSGNRAIEKGALYESVETFAVLLLNHFEEFKSIKCDNIEKIISLTGDIEGYYEEMGVFRDTPLSSEPPVIAEAPIKATTTAKSRPKSFLAFAMKKSGSDQELNTSDSKDQLNKSDRFFTGLLGKLVGKSSDGDKPKKSERRKTPSMSIEQTIFGSSAKSVQPVTKINTRHSLANTPVESPDSVFQNEPLESPYSVTVCKDYYESEPSSPINIAQSNPALKTYPFLTKTTIHSDLELGIQTALSRTYSFSSDPEEISPECMTHSIEIVNIKPLERTIQSRKDSRDVSMSNSKFNSKSTDNISSKSILKKSDQNLDEKSPRMPMLTMLSSISKNSIGNLTRKK